MDLIYKRALNETKIIIILYFLFSLNQANSDLPNISIIENKYPICFKMNNGNILILNEIGLYVTDSTFSSIINAHNFTTLIEKNDLTITKISQFSKENDEYILIFVKLSKYLLSKEGEYIKDFDISSNISVVNSYVLFLNKKFSNYIYYSLFYIYSAQITISNFYININSNENTLLNIQSYKPTLDSFPSLVIQNHEIACNYMNSNEYGKIILCFFYSFNPNGIMTSAFDPNNNFNEINDKIPINYISTENIKSLTSTTNNNLKKTIIGYLYDAKGCCLFYDIDLKNFTNYEDVSEGKNQYILECSRDGILNPQIYFFKETQEFIFICNDYNYKFALVQFSV